MQKQTKKLKPEKRTLQFTFSAWSPLITELGEHDNVNNDGVDCNDDNSVSYTHLTLPTNREV